MNGYIAVAAALAVVVVLSVADPCDAYRENFIRGKLNYYNEADQIKLKAIAKTNRAIAGREHEVRYSLVALAVNSIADARFNAIKRAIDRFIIGQDFAGELRQVQAAIEQANADSYSKVSDVYKISSELKSLTLEDDLTSVMKTLEESVEKIDNLISAGAE